MFALFHSLTVQLVGHCAPLLAALQPALSGSGGGSAPSGPAPSGTSHGPSGGTGMEIMNLLFPIAVFAFVYFFMLRPAGKEREEQESLQKELREGDRVVTRGGMVGKVAGLDGDLVTLELAEKVRVKFLRDAVIRRFEPAGASSGNNDKK